MGLLKGTAFSFDAKATDKGQSNQQSASPVQTLLTYKLGEFKSRQCVVSRKWSRHVIDRSRPSRVLDVVINRVLSVQHFAKTGVES